MSLTPGDEWGDYLDLDYTGSISGGTASSWQWDFGDGSTATGISGTHTYSGTGTFSVTLTATSSNSAISNSPRSGSVTISEPEINASADISVDGSNLEINYACTSEGAVSWAWNFGDTETSTSKSGYHIYDEPDDYTVTLTVTSAGGATDTETFDVPFSEGPTAYFTVDNETGGSPLYVEFTDGSEENPYTGADIVKWKWDFDCDGETETFDDDDNDADTSFTFEDDGTYTVTLTVTDDDGEKDTYEMDIVVDDDASPEADYYIDSDSETSGKAPLTIKFHDDSDEAEDTDADIITYLWKFYDEDGDLYKYSYNENPELEFEDAGVYTLVYTITDADGMTDTLTKKDLITVTAGLSVTFYGSPVSGTEPVTVTFYATDGVYNDYDIDTYYWIFGDGSTSSESDTTTSHKYSSPGTFTVKLKVTDEKGNTYTYTKENYISVGSQTASVTAATTYAVETTATAEPTFASSVGPSAGGVSSGTKIFGLPGTEYFRGEIQRFYDFYTEYMSLLTGVFGMK